VIPPKADRKTTIPCDFAMYRWRHLIENFFCTLKQYRRVATRYPVRQNRSELRCHDLSRRDRHRPQVNVNRP
jgi:transposase